MGWIGALAIHLLLIVGLLLAGFSIPEPAEEGGMPAMLGQVTEAERIEWRGYGAQGGEGNE